MKTILVPTDFSDCAKHASETAIELAKIIDAEIHFYHFTSIPIDWASISLEDAQKRYPEVTKKVNKVNDELNLLRDMASSEGVHAKSFIGYNESYEDIVSRASDQEFNMIVMGSHGAKGIKEFFIGSNAQKVVRSSRVPVFIVKESLDTIKVSNVLFVSNFEDEMMRPFEQVISLVDLLRAKINLLFVNTPDEFYETWEIDEKMESFIALAGHRLERAETINTRSFEEGVQRYCVYNNEGILTIATHSNKGFSRVFRGGLAEKVVNHVNIPVFSIPIQQASGYPRM